MVYLAFGTKWAFGPVRAFGPVQKEEVEKGEVGIAVAVAEEGIEVALGCMLTVRRVGVGWM